MRLSAALAAAALAAAAMAACLLADPGVARTAPLGLDVFQKWNRRDTPGCVLGVDHADEPRLIKSFGAADLEHDIPNTADTVFEAGSVSKQFTAAAILTLASEGKLTLNDDVRKYLPELPDYGAPITVAELLGHTSGLRDWGAVEAMAGWPRTSRIYTQSDTLDIAARQRSVNFPPGTAYTYTNTGYNLLAIIVARVSGESLAEFTRRRFFVPLGLSHTQWRDDFSRIVAGRAVAYRFAADGYHQQMPFDNAYGNGGLLTTIGDLLRWNAALGAGELGPYVTAELTRATVLTDGRRIAYARGLVVSTYHGATEIAHSGATAAYRAWLGRYPEQRLSIALLCNAGDADSTQLAHAVADEFLPGPVARPVARPAVDPPAARLRARIGLFVERRAGVPVRLELEGGSLRIAHGATLLALTPAEFAFDPQGPTMLRFVGDDRFVLGATTGEEREYDRVEPWRPRPAELLPLAGRYESVEALATYEVAVRDGHLLITPLDRRGESVDVVPLYADTFQAASADVDQVYHFRRDPTGRVTDFEIRNPSVYALRFGRLTEGR